MVMAYGTYGDRDNGSYFIVGLGKGANAAKIVYRSPRLLDWFLTELEIINSLE